MLKHITQSKEWSEKGVAEKGFTLVELLVVIAILGILAVVGVLAFGGLTDSAETAVNETEEAQIQTAVDAFLAKSSTNTVAMITTGTDTLNVGALETANVIKDATEIKCPYTIDAAGDVAQGTCP